MTEKPQNIDEYKVWASTNHGHEFDKRCAMWYKVATQNIFQTLEDSLLPAIQREIESADTAYRLAVGADLFVTPEVPVLRWSIKTFESAIDKLYRTNVVWNHRWPNPPASAAWTTNPGAKAWVGPYDCLQRLDDVIRTRVVCKYLDGPTFLSARIRDLVESMGIGCEVGSRELDAGYYSHHMYFDINVENIGPGLETTETRNRIELQITTQLQDVLMNLTHRFYEKDRLKLSRAERPWRWDYGTPQFKSAYLGHTLHLLEALVIEVRDEIGETDE